MILNGKKDEKLSILAPEFKSYRADNGMSRALSIVIYKEMAN